MKITKLILGYSIEIIIGAAILYFVEDIRWFLFYLMIVLLFTAEKRADYLRKLIRVYQVANEGKLMSIIRKMGIKPEELQKLGDEVESGLTEKQRESLYQDMNDLGLK